MLRRSFGRSSIPRWFNQCENLQKLLHVPIRLKLHKPYKLSSSSSPYYAFEALYTSCLGGVARWLTSGISHRFFTTRCQALVPSFAKTRDSPHQRATPYMRSERTSISSFTMIRPSTLTLGCCRCRFDAATPIQRLGRRPLTSQPRRQLDRPLNPLNPVASRSYQHAQRASVRRRMYLAGGGFVVSFAGAVLVASLVHPSDKQPDRAEAPPDASAFDPHEGLVKTSSDAVPYFPRMISLPSTTPTESAALPVGTGDVADEYGLVGLGARTVSFLRIKVYVVGLYVQKSDMAKLQARFIKRGADVEGASTLVAGESAQLRQRLSDPEKGQELWNAVLREEGIRSAMRVVPTRSTDFDHLKTGWLKAIELRSRGGLEGESFEDDAFGNAVGTFKDMLGRGSLGKGKVLLLERGAQGALSLWKETDQGSEKMGEVGDERISRLVWLNYLGGKSVASEEARSSIIEGVMDLVSRPVGTVETKVV